MKCTTTLGVGAFHAPYPFMYPLDTDALKILDQRIGEDQQLRDMTAEERLNVRVARKVYQVRREAGLTQAELADLVGTKQQVIARLEDADYERHWLTMLQRIAMVWLAAKKVSHWYGPRFLISA